MSRVTQQQGRPCRRLAWRPHSQAGCQLRRSIFGTVEGLQQWAVPCLPYPLCMVGSGLCATQSAHGTAVLAACSLLCRLLVPIPNAVLGPLSTCSCCISDAHPLVFFRRALTTSLTPRFICLRLAAFLASFSTCSAHCHALHLSPHIHRSNAL